ncbi:DNA-binding response regulator [Fibrisoma montanum]|uniref:DNA-binding response regulator n=1 Tax=Fibrisoma montanum TaxID=2305895 RepID=A0A418LZ18_9BACT|nr:response regulator transcription factor [Fibrisoma montanum]RIV18506.1 DNA-binding response regulator [Fibrisoma montanum]
MTGKAVKARMVLLYGLALGCLLSVMAWSRYRFMVIDHALEAYVLLVAVLFVGVGIWVGLRWSAPVVVEKTVVRPAPVVPLQPAPEALEQLGISSRELEVLIQLAQGYSNEEIASHLFVSTNTVKTHLSNLYAKLDVKRRTQAVDKARSLGLIR